MFMDRDYDEPIDPNGIVDSSSNFGSLDISDRLEDVPDWLGKIDVDDTLENMNEGIPDTPIDFFRDIPRDHFTDRSTKEVIRFDPDRNPTTLVDREYLYADRSALIRDAATMFQETIKSLRPYIALQHPVLTRLETDDVRADGHILNGKVIWAIDLIDTQNPIPKRSWQNVPSKKMRVEIAMKVVDGILERPLVFCTSTLRPYPLTVEGCKLALNWHERPLTRKRAPSAEIAWTTERDYRAW